MVARNLPLREELRALDLEMSVPDEPCSKGMKLKLLLLHGRVV